MMTRPPELLDVDRIVERRQPGPGDMPWDRARAIIRNNAGTISSVSSLLILDTLEIGQTSSGYRRSPFYLLIK